MANVSTYVTSFAKRPTADGAGDQTLTLPFTPKALVFTASGRTTTGIAAGHQYIIWGVTDGTRHWSVCHASQQSSLATAYAHRNDAALVVVDFAGAVVGQATVSWSGATVTVSWSVNSGLDGLLINVFAVGGSGVQAFVGSAAASGSTGSQSFTGSGFTPTAVLTLGSAPTSAATVAATGFGPASIGWLTADGQGAATADIAVGGIGDFREVGQRSDRCVLALGQAGVSFAAEKTSLDADGFTVNWTVARAGRLGYLMLRGVLASSVVFEAPSTTSSDLIAFSAGRPKGGIFVSVGQVASTSSATDCEICTGFADSVGRQRVSWSSSRDRSGTTAQYHSDVYGIMTGDQAAGSVTTLESLGEISMSSEGVTVDWTITNADTAEVIGLILGDTYTAVEYEDPCSITEPRLFTTIATESETLRYSSHPLRDTAAMGGYAEPRLLSVSAVTKAASDPSTGAWSPQTARTTFADVDRVNRARSSTRPRFRNCAQQIYLTSNARRLAGGAPRVVFSGIVNADSCDDNLAWTTEINDEIGDSYSLFREEKQIPQRLIGVAHFPNAGKDALNRAEPVVAGRLAPKNPANGEGVVDAITVGLVALNGTRNTPGAGDVTALVADMQAAADIGELAAQFGSRLGYGDCSVYEYGTVPTSEAGLKAVFGTGDIDAILSDYAVTGSSDFLCAIVACHAISEVLDGSNGDPSVWINDTQLDPAELGTSWWMPQIPGDATWAATFGADLFTDIIGSDGETRRYTLIAFDPASQYGLDVAAGGRVHLDCVGFEDLGNGLGVAVLEFFAQYRHILINFLLQNYLAGSWLSVPQFLFSDGSTLMDRVDEGSFDDAASIVSLSVSGGYVGGFKFGDRSSIRDVIARLNQSGGCLLGHDDYGRLFVQVLDTRRTQFLNGHRTLRDKVDILPGFKLVPKPEWQVNRLYLQYARNYVQGVYERSEGGGGIAPVEDGTAQARDGIITKTLALDCIRDDATAYDVGARYVELFKVLPMVAQYSRRGLCGLEDDVLDGVPITHWNGDGADGWEDHAVWVLSKTFDGQRGVCSFTALDVDRMLS